MAKFLANLLFEPKGKHDPAQAYTIKDTVMSADGSRVYFAIQDVPAGVELTDTTYWKLQIDLSTTKADMESATSAANAAAETANTAAANVKGDIDRLSEENAKLKGDLGNLDLSKDYKEWINGYLNGKGEYENVPSWICTEFIPIPINNLNIYFTGYVTQLTGSYRNIWFYDIDKTVISGIQYSEASHQVNNEKLTVPNGAKYIRMMTYNSYSNKPFEFNYVLSEAIDIIGEVINNSIIESSNKDMLDYISLSLFEEIAVIGDSYSSGAIYGVNGATDGRHNGMSWLNILARRNGVNGTLYSVPGITAKKWLTGDGVSAENYNNYCKPRMLADSPKNLYLIFMGINDTLDGSIADCNEDYNLNNDTFFGNYGKIIGEVKNHSPKAKIVCIVSHFNSHTDGKGVAIKSIADFYGVKCIYSCDDDFFNSDFYLNNMYTAHPIGITYSGMALAFERLLKKCIIENVNYFIDYTGND